MFSFSSLHGETIRLCVYAPGRHLGVFEDAASVLGNTRSLGIDFGSSAFTILTDLDKDDDDYS